MKSIAAIFAIIAVACAATTNHLSELGEHAEILRQAREYSYEVRGGRSELTPRAVALLERATEADPDNAPLWNALGVAYFNQAAATANRPVMDRASMQMSFQRALTAYEQALRLDPSSAKALAGHGMALTVLSALQRRPEWAAKGVAEMDRAIALQPTGLRVRLTRAFTGINLPPPLRNTQSITEDLEFLLRTSDGTRAGDVLRIMLGDVFAEDGALALARGQYLIAGRSGSVTQEQARSRIAALDRGEIPAGEVARLRSRLAGDCRMCHAD